MRVSVLHVGDTKVPFGQFYGGSDGEWLGLRAISNWRQAHDHRNYYRGPLLRAAFDEDQYLLSEEQQLLAHAAASRERPITTDHAGQEGPITAARIGSHAGAVRILF